MFKGGQPQHFKLFWPSKKITFTLKETYLILIKIEKHLRDNNKP